jgi:hypothetical protein
MKTGRNKFIFSVLFCMFSSLVFSKNDREIWINSMVKIADPVLLNLSNNTLRKNMPVETTVEGSKRGREKVTHLEAVGRLLCGMAPWLELGADQSAEGKLRQQYIELVKNGLQNAVDPNSPDKLNFTTDNQALVDAAFLAQSFLRAPIQIWGNLDAITQSRMLEALKSTRIIKPNESNWLLFSAIIEATLLQLTGECKMETINYALTRFDEWYKGDAWYGDGKNFHFDYYNSIVIHPMLLDILTVLKNKNLTDSTIYTTEKNRSIRYAEQLRVVTTGLRSILSTLHLRGRDELHGTGNLTGALNRFDSVADLAKSFRHNVRSEGVWLSP